ncbi:hypothetical protein KEM52_000598 [Ascosphaera acerosa]|nr:hypothetical protein KEM52_000598 [Ascosphaera acerosa]
MHRLLVYSRVQCGANKAAKARAGPQILDETAGEVTPGPPARRTPDLIASPPRRRQPVLAAQPSPSPSPSPRSPRWAAPPPESTVSSNLRIKTHVGPWKLGCTLGKGMTSRVRVAKHVSSGAKAAIKIIPKKEIFPAKQSKKSVALAVEREIVILKLLEHPGIIQLLDVWESKAELYLVLEYAPRGSLFTYLSERGALPEPEAMCFFRQLLGALAAIHSYNICHRDLKPENILLDARLRVKLADFGMAAFQPPPLCAPRNLLTASCGSPHYAAPEVIAGRPYRGDKADLWSCGVILFAMLAGYLPFDSSDADAAAAVDRTLALVCAGDYAVPPWFSRATRNLVQLLLRKRPADRPAARDLLKHPALRKYQREHRRMFPELDELVYGDELLGQQIPDKAREGLPSDAGEVDEGILAAMAVLWGPDADADALLDALLDGEVNHQKLFYRGLLDYKAGQLQQNEGYFASSPCRAQSRRSGAGASATTAAGERDRPMLALPASSPVIKALRGRTRAMQSASTGHEQHQEPQRQDDVQSSVDSKAQASGLRPDEKANAACPARGGSKLKQEQRQRVTSIPVVPSYDPYRASRMQLIDPSKVDHMKVIVYPPRMEVSAVRSRARLAARETDRPGLAKSLSAAAGGRTRTSTRGRSPSLASARSRGSLRGASAGDGRARAPAATKAKRNVSFQHVGKARSGRTSSQPTLRARPARLASQRTDNVTPPTAEAVIATPLRASSNPAASATTSPATPDTAGDSLIVRRKRAKGVALPPEHDATSELTIDVRKASHEIELLCEHAFNDHGPATVATAPGRKCADVCDATATGARASENVRSAGQLVVERPDTMVHAVSAECTELPGCHLRASGEEATVLLSQASDERRTPSTPSKRSGQFSDDIPEHREAKVTPQCNGPPRVSKKGKAWATLEAALKSLETLCPDAPISLAQQQQCDYSPTLAPPSPTLAQLKRTQEQLATFQMTATRPDAGLIREVQQRLSDEIACLEEDRSPAPVTHRCERSCRGRVCEPVSAAMAENDRREVAGAASGLQSSRLEDWNPNIARLARRASQLALEQAPTASVTGAGAEQNDGAPDDADLGVRPLMIRKRKSSDLRAAAAEDAEGAEASTTPTTPTTPDATTTIAITPASPVAAPPQQRRVAPSGPRRNDFRPDLEPIAEVKTATSDGSNATGRKPPSERRDWSWRQGDEGGTGALAGAAAARGEGGLVRGQARTHAHSRSMSVVDPIYGGRSQSRGQRLKSFFSRSKSWRSRWGDAGRTSAQVPDRRATVDVSTSASGETIISHSGYSSGASHDNEQTFTSAAASNGLGGRPAIPARHQSSRAGGQSGSDANNGSSSASAGASASAATPLTRVIAFEARVPRAAKAVRKILHAWRPCGLKEIDFEKDENGHRTFACKTTIGNSFGLPSLEIRGRFLTVEEASDADPAVVAAEHCLLVVSVEGDRPAALHNVTNSLIKELGKKRS